MKSTEIEEVGKCMRMLLMTEAFDAFGVSEVTIIHGISYVIDGHLKKQSQGEGESYDSGAKGNADAPSVASYGKVRSLCYEMMKGKELPEYFKFTLLCPKEMLSRLMEESGSVLEETDVASLSLTFTYKDGRLSVMSGTAFRIFTTDRTLENAWDEKVNRMMQQALA